MPPRLAHKKSRNGCKRCKARRVKCDESHPICNNCRRHNVTCEFPIVPLKLERHSRRSSLAGPITPQSIDYTRRDSTWSIPDSAHWSIPQSWSRPPSPLSSDFGTHSPHDSCEDDDDTLNSEERRWVETRLLYHYTHTVSHTFPGTLSHGIINMWNIDAVHLGFKYDFLLNAIFAITALHIVRSLPESPSFYMEFQNPVDFTNRVDIMTQMRPSLGNFDPRRIHRFYLNLALQQQRQAVANLTSANANALILSSSMLSYQGLRLHPSDEVRKSYSPPCQWLHMTSGIGQIAKTAIPLMDDAALKQFHANIEGKPDFRDRGAIFNPANGKPFESLLNWHAFPEEDLSMSGREVYETAVDYIGGVHKALLDKEDSRAIFRRILCFGNMVPAKFITFVEERRPRALAILAHHCAMAKAVDDHWVFHGFAEREVRGIQSILPQEWQWSMVWPLAMLKQEIGSLP